MGCEIPLKDNWYIKSDQYQFICIQRYKQQSGKNAGEWAWDYDSATYHRTVPQLLRHWGDKLVRVGGYKTVRELVEGIRRVESILNEIALKTALSVKEGK